MANRSFSSAGRDFAMRDEGPEMDRKSVRYVLERQKDLDGLACDCVAFANALGGVILLGIENDETEPPATQRIPDDLSDRLIKRIPQITVNVRLDTRKKTAANGGEYVEITVFRNEQGFAATSDGRYFIRAADETCRLMPDDLSRLMTERNSLAWELQPTARVPRNRYDKGKLAAFAAQIRASERVSSFVKGKSDEELLDHYLFADGPYLTNLGILWIGRRQDRAALLHAPLIQVIKFDERGVKVWKRAWQDYDLNPLELVNAVWEEVPDWRESYELPDGLFRKTVPHYDEVVVRELLANALVHRPYTQRGDIFLNLHPDRLEVHNPGLLPIGVTPRNILHASSKRNPHLARVFYDLKMMEGEGCGFDRMYEVLLSSGKAVPEVREGDDRVVVTIRKRILNPSVVNFVAKADQQLQLTQRERIALGLLVQHGSLAAIEMRRVLELKDSPELRHWVGRLVDLGVVKSKGRTKAMEYYVAPELLRKLDFKGATTLKNIEGHRLRELILRDLEIYRQAGISAIHARIGLEIPRRKLQHQLRLLLKQSAIGKRGQRKGTVYLWTKGR